MFYRPAEGHPLPHNPFKAIVSPRPIGWISTRDKEGNNNLAPYSFFNGVADNPAQVMFASTGTKPDRDDTKDSLSILKETGVFCVNIVGYADRDAMNKTSQAFPAGADEFKAAGLAMAECQSINCGFVATTPAAMECEVSQIVTLEGPSNFAVFGRVTGVHLNDDCIVDGIFDVTTYRPLARLGYRDYSVVDNVFSLARPDD